MITPKVNTAQEFIEIAFGFSNPLDLVREKASVIEDVSRRIINQILKYEFVEVRSFR